MPRFVVLRHEPNAEGSKPLHWDFMLERGDALKTWELTAEPQPDREIDAEQLSDHRLAYLTYEGEVSGNRGSVQQWDRGTYDLVRDEIEVVEVRLDGQRLRGAVELKQSSPGAQRWIFTFSPSSLTMTR